MPNNGKSFDRFSLAHNTIVQLATQAAVLQLAMRNLDCLECDAILLL